MKITRNTPEHLIVEDKPWLLGVLLGVFVLTFTGVALTHLINGDPEGLGFLAGAAFCVLFMFIFLRRSQAIFDSTNNTLSIRKRSLMGYSEIIHPLSEVGHAFVEANRGSNGTTYRVTLVFPDGQSAGQHPLTFAYSNIGDHKDIAQTINAWLDSHRAQA